MYVFDRDRRTLTKLTNDIYDDRDPEWSPDGSKIVFVSDRTGCGGKGVYNIFLLSLENNDVAFVTQDSVSYSSPTWWRDNAHLLCVSNRNGLQQIESITLDESRAAPSIHRLTRFTPALADPGVTEDGSLFFTAFDSYRFQIRKVGAQQIRVDSTTYVGTTVYDSSSTRWSPGSLAPLALSDTMMYKRIFGLDVVQSQISTDPIFGTLGGAAIGLSDMLGDDRYSVLLFNTAQTSSEILTNFNLAVSHTFQIKRSPVEYGVYHYTGRRYDLSDPDVYYYERAFGGYFTAAYPFSRFDRFEGTVSVTNSYKEALYGVNTRNAMLLSNSISYIHDNALYYWTGPIDGSRFNVTLAYTSDIRYSFVDYYSLMFDYRQYFRLGLRSCVAVRFDMFYNEGKEARRFFAGGSWDLRGWPLWSIRGTKSWLTSCELRFPLLDRVAFAFPIGTMDLGILRGAFFFDAGNNWDNAYQTTLGSIGAGLRLSMFGAFVLRYDFGKKILNNFSKLQNNLFQQFFFGWDF